MDRLSLLPVHGSTSGCCSGPCAPASPRSFIRGSLAGNKVSSPGVCHFLLPLPPTHPGFRKPIYPWVLGRGVCLLTTCRSLSNWNLEAHQHFVNSATAQAVGSPCHSWSGFQVSFLSIFPIGKNLAVGLELGVTCILSRGCTAGVNKRNGSPWPCVCGGHVELPMFTPQSCH